MSEASKRAIARRAKERGDYRYEVNSTDRLVDAAKAKREFRYHREQAAALIEACRGIVNDIEKYERRGNHEKVVKLHDLLDQQLALASYHQSLSLS